MCIHVLLVSFSESQKRPIPDLRTIEQIARLAPKTVVVSSHLLTRY